MRELELRSVKMRARRGEASRCDCSSPSPHAGREHGAINGSQDALTESKAGCVTRGSTVASTVAAPAIVKKSRAAQRRDLTRICSGGRASPFVNQSTTLQSVRRGCMSLASDEQTPRANQLMTDWFDRTPPSRWREGSLSNWVMESRGGILLPAKIPFASTGSGLLSPPLPAFCSDGGTLTVGPGQAVLRADVGAGSS